MISTNEKLEICKEKRRVAARSLFLVLKKLLKSNVAISEVKLRDEWYEELKKHEDIYEGWYNPPPAGMGVLFGNIALDKRVNFISLRDEKNWPKNDIFLNIKEGVIYVYASPVDKESGIIGDFGMSLYLGRNPAIIHHFKEAYSVIDAILDHAEIGMSFSELSSFAKNLFMRKGFSNDIECKTSPSMGDLGHTIPASYESWSLEELKLIKEQKWDSVIKNKRVFIRYGEDFKIKPGVAFTIEPRLLKIDNPHMPMTTFHRICMFNQNGRKETLSNFEELFKLVNMNYMP